LQQGLRQAVRRLPGQSGQALGDYRVGGVLAGVGEPAVPVPAQRSQGARLPAGRDPPRPRLAGLLPGAGYRSGIEAVAEGGIRVTQSYGACTMSRLLLLAAFILALGCQESKPPTQTGGKA